MGTDIHAIAEVLSEASTTSPTRRWKAIAEAIFDDPYYSDARPISEYNQPKTKTPFGQRNYNVFAALAGVRNGFGFAGVKTGNALVPVAEPKGSPDPVTASAEWLALDEGWGADLHGISYLTAAELLAYDWDQPKVSTGVISEVEYLALRTVDPVTKAVTVTPPSSWSGGIFATDVVVMTAEEYEALEPDASGAELGGKRIYVQVQWTTPLRETIGAQFFRDLDALCALSPNALDEVRVVFGFDN